MTFSATAQADVLARAFAMAARVSPRPTSSVIPITTNLRLTCAQGRLTVTGVNLESAIEIGIAAEKASGETTAPAAELSAIASRLNGGGAIKLEQKDTTLAVSQGKSRFKLPTMPAEGMLITMPNDHSGDLPLSGEALSGALKLVEGAASTSAAKPFLCGVFFDMTGGDVPMVVATDGEVISASPLGEAAAPEGMESVIVPSAAMSVIHALCAAEQVTISTGKALLGITAGETRYRTKVIDYQFPTWRRVIRAQDPTRVRVSGQLFRHAIEKLGAIGPAAVTLDFGDTIGISARAYEERLSGASAADNIPHESMSGPPIKLSFASENLKWIAASLPGAEVLELGLDQPGSNMRVSDPARPRDIRLVMPILG